MKYFSEYPKQITGGGEVKIVIVIATKTPWL